MAKATKESAIVEDTTDDSFQQEGSRPLLESSNNAADTKNVSKKKLAKRLSSPYILLQTSLDALIASSSIAFLVFAFFAYMYDGNTINNDNFASGVLEAAHYVLLSSHLYLGTSRADSR